jgi:hypothetical protein
MKQKKLSRLDDFTAIIAVALKEYLKVAALPYILQFDTDLYIYLHPFIGKV